VTGRQFALLTVLALTWGCSYLFIKVIVEGGVEPIGMAGARTALGTLTLLPFAWFGRAGFRQPRSAWAGMIGLGFLNFAIPWTLFGVAGKHVPSGVSAVANASAPLWSAILVAILLRSDRMTPSRMIGLLLGFAGVLVLMGEDLSNVSGSHAGSIALILLATLCYGFSSVAIRKWLSSVPPVPLATVQVGSAAVGLMTLAFATGAFAEADMNAKVTLSMLALGGIGSGLAVVVYMHLIQNLGPVRASVVTYMIPPVGVFLGWLVLDEPIGWNLAASLALILAGVALVQGLAPRWLLARFQPVPNPVPASSE
jgi:drug/metabolite transporter (DMT)-like permease